MENCYQASDKEIVNVLSYSLKDMRMNLDECNLHRGKRKFYE